MAKLRDQRGGRWFLVAIAMLAFAAYSIVIAATTAEDCRDRGLGREWQFIPPEWECTGRGFG